MRSSEEIEAVWRTFDHHPMETLTKAWWMTQAPKGMRQRSVTMMESHRKSLGTSGNCYDLTLWLLYALQEAGVEAEPVGHGWFTSRAHAAVLAKDRVGAEWLCDLGDQWIQPVPVDAEHEAFPRKPTAGLFPGASVSLSRNGNALTVCYHRHGGKKSDQTYNLCPVDRDTFSRACAWSQDHLKKRPLLEIRIPWEKETALWEWDGNKAVLSTSRGLVRLDSPSTATHWPKQIHDVAGIDPQVVTKALEVYDRIRKTG
ncbi:hypothetical protein [Desmospora profundinema]|uniref:Transglutaminase-like domain-containing protein n=1 Tax=Desmospora profundinema TaxID=1571184 RepID=A0ABU1IL09_9BACL|nr:hypothetical protein [Desmospora profundinema]MDR6225465.1 hypothetical protein [Desmospora profundinema]